MKHLFLTLLSTLLLSACSFLKSGLQTPPARYKNIQIHAAKAGDRIGPCEPTICINPTNPLSIAAGSVLNNYHWSEDGGKTWKTSTLVSSNGVFGDPVLIADQKGHFYFAHLSDPEGKGWSSPKLLDRIVIQKSTDGGKTYDNGSFCGENHPKDQDKQWLAVDPSTGHLYCTWTEFDLYNSKNTAQDKSRILFAKSTDAGKSWTEVQKINQFDGDCLDEDETVEGAVPSVGPDGTIYVAWSWNSKIWFDKSVDGGKTWLEEDGIVTDQPGGWSYDVKKVSRCNGLPFTDCDRSNGPYRGTIYVNWTDQRNGTHNPDVFTAYSRDQGKTWSAPVRVNDDATEREQFFSSMTIDQATGYVYCVFYDRRAYSDHKTDVWLAVSKDGGQTYENRRISASPFEPEEKTFFGDYNHISAYQGMVRPIWTRLENGMLSVWTALIQIEE